MCKSDHFLHELAQKQVNVNVLFSGLVELFDRYQVRISGSMQSFPNKNYGADPGLTRLAAVSYHKLATSMLIRFETLKGKENHFAR